MGYSSLNTTLLGIPTGVLATVWQLLIAIPYVKLTRRRCLIIAGANMVPMISALLLWQLPASNIHWRLAAYYVFYTYWGPYVLSNTLLMANTSGYTKKITMNAVFFVANCIGNIIGPQVFQSPDAPNYPKGYIGLLACFIVASAAISLYGLL
ncbi:hypothetical protein BDW59DRAFT_159925 [Aspergillus cavernicola]|uniref:Major facilitator superfamily domain-containing protein n=1 Tax=Aspergillus cavernicola TaxID=176166 RepID=A0ABR4IM49_9EURO